jgi:hypothetical protein
MWPPPDAYKALQCGFLDAALRFQVEKCVNALFDCSVRFCWTLVVGDDRLLDKLSRNLFIVGAKRFCFARFSSAWPDLISSVDQRALHSGIRAAIHVPLSAVASTL